MTIKIQGLRFDYQQNRPQVPTVRVPKGTGALFIGSAVDVVSSLAVPAGTSNSSFIAGSVIALEDSNGKSCQNLASADGGTVLVAVATNGTRFIINASGTVVAADLNGAQNANLTAETATPASQTSDGNFFSLRRLDMATKAAAGTQRQLILLQALPIGLDAEGDALNTGLGTNVDVLVTVNPLNIRTIA
jgi:hypothetical protein